MSRNYRGETEWGRDTESKETVHSEKTRSSGAVDNPSLMLMSQASEFPSLFGKDLVALL